MYIKVRCPAAKRHQVVTKMISDGPSFTQVSDWHHSQECKTEAEFATIVVRSAA